MPHKLEDYEPFITPYKESYSIDTKLWYNDDEVFPEPVTEPRLISNFAISGLFGIGEWTDDLGYIDNTQEDIDLMLDVCFNNGYDDSYCFGITITWDNKKLNCVWSYRYNKRNLERFITEIKKGKSTKFYTDSYSEYKLFSFPAKDNKIRLVIQDYTTNSDTCLENIFDGLVDKKYFILSMSSVLTNAQDYLLDYVYEYAEINKISAKLLKEAVAIAKDKK